MQTRRIAIIGGGITGLTAAWQLLKLQKGAKTAMSTEITLYEASTRLGGKVISYREGGMTLEGGPDSMLARKPAGVGLLRELGLESEIVHSNEIASNTFIVKDGQLEPMPRGTYMGIPLDVPTFLQNTVLSAQGKGRALFDLVLPKSPTDVDVSLGSFLRSRLGSEWVERLGEPLLAGIYAGRIDDLSLQATWPIFSDLAQKYRSLIVGSKALRSRQTISKSGRSAFVTVRGGLETIIERLADEIRDTVHLRLSHRVLELHPEEQGYRLMVESAGEQTEARFDAVVVCTPVPQMKALLDAYLPARSKSFDVPYTSTATVVVGYPANHVNVDLSKASGFLVPRTENRAITASTWVSSKWPHATNEEHIILRCYVGRAGQEQYLQLSDEEMVKEVHREIGRIVGIKASPVFHKVTRWNESEPNYPVGHLTRWKHLEEDVRTHLPGLCVAGAGYQGLGLPDCIAHGQHVAQEIHQYVEAMSEQD